MTRRERTTNFVSERLNLPIFINDRNRYKLHDPTAVLKYVETQIDLYTKKCDEEKCANETVIRKTGLKSLGFYDQHPFPCKEPKRGKINRDSFSVDHDWLLAPNRYTIPLDGAYKTYKGAGGAFWHKLPTNKSIIKKEKTYWRFYDIKGEMEKLSRLCQIHKGVFVTNARERKSTERMAVTNTDHCYHSPRDPGPAHYHPKGHTVEKNMAAKKIAKALNPHLFYRGSCVPLREGTYKSTNDIGPAPGVYELRYRNICPCSNRRIYCPDLQLLIDKEKRLKFRRLPYKKIKARLYCSPDWRHVTGRGYRYLFKKPRNWRKPKKLALDLKRIDRQFQLYTDAKYLSMINNPLRKPISIRTKPIERKPFKIVFNCMARYKTRRQIVINKNIAFLSGQDRFPDSDKPPIMTFSMLDRIKARLPLDRQLRDLPVTRQPIEKIENKLLFKPKHMLPAYEPELRKRLFKFSPLPPAKVLVTEQDLRGESIDGKYVPDPLYGKEIKYEDFLKPGTNIYKIGV